MNSCTATPFSPTYQPPSVFQHPLSKDYKALCAEYDQIEQETPIRNPASNSNQCGENSLILSRAPTIWVHLEQFLKLLYSDVDVVIMVAQSKDIKNHGYPLVYDAVKELLKQDDLKNT